MHIGVMGHRGLSDITEMLVRGELWRLVTGYQTYGLVGVSPLGEGPETWFAEAVLEHGGALEVLGDPERPSPGLMRRARAVHRLAPGLDRTAALLGLVDELVAVWDGEPGGAVADAVARARAAGLYVHTVWPEGSGRA
ncbi:hypothetical protein GXW83_03710 [Streptacidiphilus sp. PB12-B1b]|uniref:hypothetical protein n=1 Tax=Streptacidiphilus sp. PB12-B1b TaxID=2705012 RepID=UPI0015FDFE66|nr:hypothetical protein [Streptacidiphilus sp. PB12-B1b]QMU75000.1 hypothetical protein GXW83_03710 [Streptacidiphilus sp. PB12-B1b]